MLISWRVYLAGKSILHCSVGLGDGGRSKYVMYSGYEVGSHEERLERVLCQYSPGMRQLEESEASHRVAYDFTFRGDQPTRRSWNQAALDGEASLRYLWKWDG